VKWLADENLDNAIVRGLLRRSYGFDVVRAQDVPQISGEEDTVMLDWATRNGRVVLTHDVSTMIPAMREQLRTSTCALIVFVPDFLPTPGASAD
jgi:predicted nuclease of predicted toxin-antitoxin system